ncbi:aquaporin-11 [Tetranychus urticae]|uniref:Aquaporin n=1 Tax=Tetranychus urticae TaxID=32264 RepID=T1KR13_TETUR|nr:aquaporin-11 [Tetranychus urticae]
MDNLLQSAIPYSILILNAALFWILRKLLSPILPRKFALLFWEIISTIELCSGCAELGVIWTRHGNIGLAIGLFLACLWWCNQFGDAEACPCGPIEDAILLRQPITQPKIYLRLIGQAIGAYVTAMYIDFIWCFHLTPEHTELHTKRCQAALQTTVLKGFLVEMFITFVSRIVCLESFKLNERLANYINSMVTVTLVLAALDTSGGFFNPILASALTLNCEGNDFLEHFLVYWVGALLGGLLARKLHLMNRQKGKMKSS